MPKRYRILRLIGTLYKIIGVVAGIAFLLASLGACVSGLIGGAALAGTFGLDNGTGTAGTAVTFVTGLVAAILILIYGLLVGLGLYAFGEAIYLLIALEENTRGTVALLERQLAAPPAQGSPNYAPSPYVQPHGR